MKKLSSDKLQSMISACNIIFVHCYRWLLSVLSAQVLEIIGCVRFDMVHQYRLVASIFNLVIPKWAKNVLAHTNRSHFLQHSPQIQSTIWLAFIIIINVHRTSNAYTHLMNSNDIWKWKKNDIRSNTFSYSRQDFIKLIKTKSRRAWFDSKPKGKLHQTRQRASARARKNERDKQMKKK